MTIRDLANRAQISKNTLLSLEQGHATHISTIKVISRALKMKPEDLAGKDFTQPAVVTVQHKDELTWFDLEAYVVNTGTSPLTNESHDDQAINAFCHLESRCLDRRVIPHLIDLRHPTPSRSHRGEEFVYILSGKVRITVGTQVHELSEGDSMCFWAAELHHYEPIESDSPAKILSIVIDSFKNS